MSFSCSAPGPASLRQKGLIASPMRTGNRPAPEMNLPWTGSNVRLLTIPAKWFPGVAPDCKTDVILEKLLAKTQFLFWSVVRGIIMAR